MHCFTMLFSWIQISMVINLYLSTLLTLLCNLCLCVNFSLNQGMIMIKWRLCKNESRFMPPTISYPNCKTVISFMINKSCLSEGPGREYVWNNNFCVFSSPELKAQVSFSDHLSSVVCLSVRLSVCLSVRL